MCLNKKFSKFILVGAILIGIVVFSFLVINTKLVGGDNPYTRFDRNYHLQENEILHGGLHFWVKGSLPIQVKEVSVINQKNLPVEGMVFFCNRQGMQMTGGSMEYDEFVEGFGANSIPLDKFHWINPKSDQEFVVGIVTKEDKIERIWVEIEYRGIRRFSEKSMFGRTNYLVKCD